MADLALRLIPFDVRQVGGVTVATAPTAVGQILRATSLAAAAWSTATYPNVVGAGDLLYASAANVLGGLTKGTARQLLQMNAGATLPQWTSNVDIPGTLDVTGVATFDAAVTMATTLGVTGAATAASFSGVGSALTALDATNIASGNLAYARLPTGAGSWDIGAGLTLTMPRNLAVSGTLAVTGVFSVVATAVFGNTSTSGIVRIEGAAGTQRSVLWVTAGSNRWQLYANSGTESGANAGTALVLTAFNDAGGILGDALTFTRATLAATFGGAVSVTGALTVTGTSQLTGVTGIGVAPSTIAALRLGGSNLTGATQVGVLFDQVFFTSAATSAMQGISITLRSAVATFTTGTVSSLIVNDIVKGAGHTVTTQYGLFIQTLTAGATNYAIYTNGTTPSAFGGAVTITGALGVTGAITGALTGNASTATALQTGRTINGTTFDGTINITVTAAAGTLTGATLAAGVTASSLTSVGTLTTLAVAGAVTAGTYNGQTISSAAAFTGSVTIATTLGVTGTSTLAAATATAVTVASDTTQALLTVRNAAAGAVKFTRSSWGNDASAEVLGIYTFASTYTPSAWEKASGVALVSFGAGGMSIGASDAATGDVRIFAGNLTSARVLISAAGAVHVGDDANANMTIGLTINQGANDDVILALKSSDIAHGMTSVAETDTYADIRKFHATNGGLRLDGLSLATTGVSLISRATTEDATRSIAATGAIDLRAATKSGSTTTSVGANKNMVVISNNGDVKQIFDSDGDSHQDVGTAWTNFDSHDDVKLLNLLSAHVTQKADPLRATFGGWLEQNRDTLTDARLVAFNSDGHHFVNMSRLQMLTVGAVRQVGAVVESHENRIAFLEAENRDLRTRLLLN